MNFCMIFYIFSPTNHADECSIITTIPVLGTCGRDCGVPWVQTNGYKMSSSLWDFSSQAFFSAVVCS